MGGSELSERETPWRYDFLLGGWNRAIGHYIRKWTACPECRGWESESALGLSCLDELSCRPSHSFRAQGLVVLVINRQGQKKIEGTSFSHFA